MKKEFPLRSPLFQTGLALVVLSVLLYLILAPLMLFIPRNRADAPWVFLLASPFPLMGLYLMWHHTGRVVLTNDAITLHRLGRTKQICYADVTEVREKDNGMPSGIVIRSLGTTIRISRFINRYPEMYNLLRWQVGVLQRREREESPFEVQVERRFVVRNGILLTIVLAIAVASTIVITREAEQTWIALAFSSAAWALAVIPVTIMALELKQPTGIRFTSGEIEARYLLRESQRWEVTESMRIQLGVQKRWVRVRYARVQSVRYPVVITFGDGEGLQLTETRIGAFGYAPEALATILRQLYGIN